MADTMPSMVVLDGPNCCGKTSLASRVSEFINRQGGSCVTLSDISIQEDYVETGLSHSLLRTRAKEALYRQSDVVLIERGYLSHLVHDHGGKLGPDTFMRCPLCDYEVGSLTDTVYLATDIETLAARHAKRAYMCNWTPPPHWIGEFIRYEKCAAELHVRALTNLSIADLERNTFEILKMLNAT